MFSVQRYLIREDDLTNKKTMTKTNTKIRTETFREQSQRAIQETCEHWDTHLMSDTWELENNNFNIHCHPLIKFETDVLFLLHKNYHSPSMTGKLAKFLWNDGRILFVESFQCLFVFHLLSIPSKMQSKIALFRRLNIWQFLGKTFDNIYCSPSDQIVCCYAQICLINQKNKG